MGTKHHSKFLPVMLWLGLCVLCWSSFFVNQNLLIEERSTPIQFESEPQSMQASEMIVLYRVSMEIFDTSVAFEMNISYDIIGTKDSGFKRFLLPANSFAWFDQYTITVHDDLGRSIAHSYRSFTGYSGDKYYEISYSGLNFQGNRTLSIYFKINGLLSESESGTVLELKNIGTFSIPVQKAEYIVHFPALYQPNSFLIQSDQRTLVNVSNNQDYSIVFAQYGDLSPNLRFTFSPSLSFHYYLFLILLNIGLVWVIYRWIRLVQQMRKDEADRFDQSQSIRFSSKELIQTINVLDLYYLYHQTQSNKDLVLTLTKLAFVDLVFQKYITVVENRLYRVLSHTSPNDPFYLGLMENIPLTGISFSDLIVRSKDLILKSLGDMKSRMISQQWVENPTSNRNKIIHIIFLGLYVVIGATFLQHWAFFLSSWVSLIIEFMWVEWGLLSIINLLNPYHIYSSYLTPKGLAIIRQGKEMIARFRTSIEIIFSKSAKSEYLIKDLTESYPYLAYLTLLPTFGVSFNAIQSWLNGLFHLENNWIKDATFGKFTQELLFPLQTADASFQIDPLVLFPPAATGGSGGCSSCGGGGGCSSCGGGGGGCSGCGS